MKWIPFVLVAICTLACALFAWAGIVTGNWNVAVIYTLLGVACGFVLIPCIYNLD